MPTATIRVGYDLKQKLKMLAIEKNKTLQEVSHEAVKLYLQANCNKNLHETKY